MQLKSSLASLGVIAVASSALSIIGAPAGAESGSLKYTCTDPLNQTRAFTVKADTNAPASVKVGETFTPSVTATVTAPDALRATLYDTAGARTVEGSTNAQGKSTSFAFTVNGAAGELPATIPVTPVPASGDLVVNATATGAPVTATAAGSIKITAGNFTAVLAGKNGTGGASLLSPYTIPCTLDAGQDATVDTVQVTPATTTPPPAPVKVDSTTKATAKYAKKAGKAVVKAKVAGSDGTKGSGKVKVTLKLGKKSKTVNARLSASGKAKAVFKKITKPGTYKVKVSYAGSETQGSSKDKTTLNVR